METALATPIRDIEREVLAVVEETFVMGFDGWMYPCAGETDAALVRVAIQGDIYRVERRRKPHTAWVPLVTMNLAEFNADSFRTWREHYRLIV